jgi:hypothetical protein
MRRPDRAVFTAGALLLALALGGCESLSNFGFDDIFSTKRPLPGERKAVFPEGVPGVPQGVPAELIKGNQPGEAQAALPEPAETQTPAEKPPAAPAAKPKAKAKPKKEAASAPASQPAARAEPADSPWPAPRQQQPAPAAWPDPPATGTFSR